MPIFKLIGRVWLSYWTLTDNVMPSLKVLVGVSLTMAVIAFAYPWFYVGSPKYRTALLVSYFVSVAWSSLVTVALFKIGRRALWLLLGAPLSFLWPLLWTWVYCACHFAHDCI